MTKELLIEEVIKSLNIEDGFFVRGMVAESIEHIESKDFQEFFNMLMGDEHSYLKPLDRVAKVAKHFKVARSNELFSGTNDMAKAYYGKFYDVNASMTTYSQENRDLVPDDRKFFEETDYKNLKDKHGAKIFSEQELYVLNEIRGS